jgi:hypothetical protein
MACRTTAKCYITVATTCITVATTCRTTATAYNIIAMTCCLSYFLSQFLLLLRCFILSYTSKYRHAKCYFLSKRSSLLIPLCIITLNSVLRAQGY